MSSNSYKTMPCKFNFLGHNVKYATFLTHFVKLHKKNLIKSTLLVFTTKNICDTIYIRLNINRRQQNEVRHTKRMVWNKRISTLFI